MGTEWGMYVPTTTIKDIYGVLRSRMRYECYENVVDSVLEDVYSYIQRSGIVERVRIQVIGGGKGRETNADLPFEIVLHLKMKEGVEFTDVITTREAEQGAKVTCRVKRAGQRDKEIEQIPLTKPRGKGAYICYVADKRGVPEPNITCYYKPRLAIKTNMQWSSKLLQDMLQTLGQGDVSKCKVSKSKMGYTDGVLHISHMVQMTDVSEVFVKHQMGNLKTLSEPSKRVNGTYLEGRTAGVIDFEIDV